MKIESIVKGMESRILAPAASLLKVALRSKRATAPAKEPQAHPLIVMGNGPSLRSFIDAGEEIRRGFDLLAVNFAAITEEFFTLRPQLYILADPHFFTATDNADTNSDEKVVKLWQNLARVDWPMTLWLPAPQKYATTRLRSRLPQCVAIKWYNLTPVEGRGFIINTLIDKGLGMPRPRNVLIPAIITALRSGYQRIFLVGADHSWSRSLWVDDRNRVVSVQPHFYKDNQKELDRVASEYAGYHLHDILQSLTVAFRSYFQIADYARRCGAEIFNATPESFIDAFPRCDYAQMRQLSAK